MMAATRANISDEFRLFADTDFGFWATDVTPISGESATTSETANTSEREVTLLSGGSASALLLVSHCLWLLVTPLVVLMGTFGNVMILVIMRRLTSSGQQSSVTAYFTALAAGDLLNLYCTGLREWLRQVFEVNLATWDSSTCKLLTWLYAVPGTFSVWTLVLMTTQRALSVVWPHRVHVICTHRKVVALLLALSLVLMLFYAHALVGFDLVALGPDLAPQCGPATAEYARIVPHLLTVNLVIYTLVPFLCLLLANGVLVAALLNSVKIRATAGAGRTGLGSGHSPAATTADGKVGSATAAARQKAVNSMTLTVLVVSLTFVLLTLPSSLFYVLPMLGRDEAQVYVQQDGSSPDGGRGFLFYTVGFLLTQTNCAVNFYLYCLTGRRFREQFCQLLACCGRE